MKITAEPRSDQWNADDFIGGARTFVISGVRVGSAEQKYDIELEGQDRAWRPPLTMIRLLLHAWGDESDDWIGRRVTLYRDESIKFGPDEVGGIRISHMSDLPGGRPLTVKLTKTRGRRQNHTVQPLPDAPPPTPKGPTAAGVVKAFEALNVDVTQLELKVGADSEKWTTADIAALAALGKSIKAGETTVYEEFETPSNGGDAA